MTYAITGLDPAPFLPLFAADAPSLAANRARLVQASEDHGFPCRVSLEEARAGERLLLVHHVSHDVEGPFRTAHAIFVRAGATRSATYRDDVPPMLARRTLGLRAFDTNGDLVAAAIAPLGEADAAIRALLADSVVGCIHVHNAAQGCFLAGVERD